VSLTQIAVAFAAGFVSFLAPCVLPLVPGYLSAVSAVQADRLGAVRELHSRYGAVTVLKGAGTLVGWGDAGAVEIAICERGNPGMATAGMGDVLTGVIAGLRAQGSDSAQAARIGVLVHALAGDSAAQGGQRGLLASDVIAELRGWVNP